MMGGSERSEFEAFVRRRGEWKRIGEFPSAKGAYLAAAGSVKSSAAASLKVTKAGELIEEDKMLSPGVFYKSKREPGVFIQKAAKRISSPGEKRDITFKGIAKLRMTKAKRNIFGR